MTPTGVPSRQAWAAGFPAELRGVFVERVPEGAVADHPDVQPGMLITHRWTEPVTDLDAFKAASRPPGKATRRRVAGPLAVNETGDTAPRPRP